MQENILMYCGNHVRQHDLSPRKTKVGFAMRGHPDLTINSGMDITHQPEERLATVSGPLCDARSQPLTRILEAMG